VVTKIAGPGREGTATLIIDGKEVGCVPLKRTVPGAFTASESFDVGMDLGSTVASAYYSRRPFAFNGRINSLRVNLIK
ncbi:MAG: arylsulfatase, partial [Luteolibacter sp.]